MDLLIDGYNLLHATDLFGEGTAAGTLEGSRDALLDFLGSRLTEAERRRSTIVFDAAAAPPGLPATLNHQRITVHFARDYPDADTMIEALLEDRPRGPGLTVVSSDRRVQRAARQRGARWREADEWYRELRSRPVLEDTERPTPDPAVGDTKFWTETFADEATLQALADDAVLPPLPAKRRKPASSSEPSPATDSPAKRSKKRGKRKPPPRSKPKQAFGEGIFEGFPPGYAEDLLEPPANSDGNPVSPPSDDQE